MTLISLILAIVLTCLFIVHPLITFFGLLFFAIVCILFSNAMMKMVKYLEEKEKQEK
jgi:O-antigen/teichoic acid export membrane protein